MIESFAADIIGAAVRSAGRARDYKAKETELAAAYAYAASQTIERATLQYGAQTPIWREIVDALGNPDKAHALLTSGTVLSEAAEPLAAEFRALMGRLLHELVAPGQAAATESVLAAVYNSRNEILKELRRGRQAIAKPDPNAELPWHDRPGAPQFQANPALDTRSDVPRLYGGFTVVSQPPIGGIKLLVAVDKQPDVESLVMFDHEHRPNHVKCSFKPVALEVDDEPQQVTLRYRYNAWANETLAGALAHGEPPEKAVHAYGHVQEAEIIWTRRILGREGANVQLWGKPSLEQAAEWHVEASRAFALILAGLVDGSIGPSFSYSNSRGTAFSNNVEEVLEHVLLHSAQYRGESAAFAIAAGLEVPDLDFIAWLRAGEPLLMP